MYIYIYIYIYIYTYIYTYTYTCIHTNIHVHIHIHVNVYIYAYLYIYMYIHVYIAPTHKLCSKQNLELALYSSSCIVQRSLLMYLCVEPVTHSHVELVT